MKNRVILVAVGFLSACSEAYPESLDLDFGPRNLQNIEWSIITPSGLERSGVTLAGVDSAGFIVDRERPHIIPSALGAGCAESVVLQNFYEFSAEMVNSSVAEANDGVRFNLDFAYPVGSDGPFEAVLGGDYWVNWSPGEPMAITVTGGEYCFRESLWVEEECGPQANPVVLNITGDVAANADLQDFRIGASSRFSSSGEPVCTAAVRW